MGIGMPEKIIKMGRKGKDALNLTPNGGKDQNKWVRPRTEKRGRK